MIIKDSAMYMQKIRELGNALADRIPNENVKVDIQDADQFARMQYGGSCVRVQLTTNSSGIDNYLVWLDNIGHGQFIRLM